MFTKSILQTPVKIGEKNPAKIAKETFPVNYKIADVISLFKTLLTFGGKGWGACLSGDEEIDPDDIADSACELFDLTIAEILRPKYFAADFEVYDNEIPSIKCAVIFDTKKSRDDYLSCCGMFEADENECDRFYHGTYSKPLTYEEFLKLAGVDLTCDACYGVDAIYGIVIFQVSP